ncbi:MAG: hypothetical protein F4Z76_03605 [Rhodothermaceae bacterium]|nr:hypothetical protein [Rhodothermaceae bacterium]
MGLLLKSLYLQMGQTKQGCQRLSVWDTSHVTENALSVLTVLVAVILDNLDPNILGRLAS